MKVHSVFPACAILGIAACLFLGSLYLAKERDARALLFFSETLLNAGADERVIVHGTAYEVRDGRAYVQGTEIIGLEALPPLKLAYQKALARRSPLLALPSIDPERLESAAKALQSTAEKLADIQESPGHAHLVRSALYPATFLAKAANLERERLAFLSSGDAKDAIVYERALRETLAAYTEGLQSFRMAFDRAVPENARDYATTRSIISKNSVLDALRELSQSAQSVAETLRQRGRCMDGWVSACREDELAARLLPQKPERRASPASLMLAREIQTLLSNAGFPFHTSGHMVVELSESACADPEHASLPALFAMYTDYTSDGSSYERAVAIDDLRIVRSETYAHIPFFQYFHAHGATYVPAFINFYTCLEQGRDLSTISGVRAVRAFAERASLSALVPGEAARAQGLERALSSSLIREADALEYLALIEERADSLPPEIVREAKSLALQLDYGSAGLEDQAFEVAELQNAVMEANENGVASDLEAPYLFFVRSNFLTVFMAANPSFNGSSADFFELNAIAQEERPYITYSALRDDSGALDQLKRDVALYIRTLNPPPEPL